MTRPTEFAPAWAEIGTAVMELSSFLTKRHLGSAVFKKGVDEHFVKLNGAITHAVLVAMEAEAKSQQDNSCGCRFGTGADLADEYEALMAPRPE